MCVCTFNSLFFFIVCIFLYYVCDPCEPPYNTGTYQINYTLTHTTVAVVLYLIKHMWIITKLLLRFCRRIQHLH